MHPFAGHRQNAVERSRVARMTKGYATGGSVASHGVTGGPQSKKAVAQRDGQAVGGEPARARLDHPTRARGGRTKKAGTHVNIILGGGAPAASPPMAGAGAPIPQLPPRPPVPAPVAGGVGPGMPPGMGPRRSGGRAYAAGGVVAAGHGSAKKSGPAFNSGIAAGTPVQHSSNKMDQPNIGRPKVITYKTGGAVEAPPPGKGTLVKKPGKGASEATGAGVGMSPNTHFGGGGGKARLMKAHLKRSGYRL